MADRVLLGARRDEALRLLATTSPRKVAEQLGVSRGAILRLQRQLKGAPSKTAEKAPKTASKRSKTKFDPATILDEDIRKRVETRDILESLLAKAKKQGDSVAAARLSKELLACLDGLRRVLTVVPDQDEAELVEAARERVLQRLRETRERLEKRGKLLEAQSGIAEEASEPAPVESAPEGTEG